VEAQPYVVTCGQSDELVMHFKTHSAVAQALHPPPQQRRGFEFPGINAPRGGGEGFHTQTRRPGAGRLRIELCDHFVPEPRRLFRTAILREELLPRLHLRDIQATASGDEQLATDGGFRIEECHLRTSGGGDFRGAQSGGAAADDRNVHAQGTKRAAARQR
jgi:hypothetical protein